jgi:hypothetical protein
LLGILRRHVALPKAFDDVRPLASINVNGLGGKKHIQLEVCFRGAIAMAIKAVALNQRDDDRLNRGARLERGIGNGASPRMNNANRRHEQHGGASRRK